jgi:mycoredoxin
MTDSKNNEAQIIMYTTSWCSDCYRAKYLLDEYGIPYVDVDVEKNSEALAFVLQINNGKRIVPTIVFPDKTILVEPSNALLAEKAGIEL